MKICENCIQAIRSRGEKIFVGGSIDYSDYEDDEEDEMVCEWCGEDVGELYEVFSE